MKRSSMLLIASASAAVAAAAWLLFWPRLTLPEALIEAVPADVEALLRVRVDRVLASDAYRRLVVERGGARGVEQIQALCGFNPLEQLTEVVAFARLAPDRRSWRYAFVARGPLRHGELIDCVGKFSGRGVAELEHEEFEGVTTVGTPGGRSRAAFIGRDGVIGGDGDAVHAALRSLRGRDPSVAREPALLDPYRALEPGSDVVLSGRVPAELKGLLQEAAPLVGPRVLELAELRALAAQVTTRPGRLAGSALLVARDPRQASELVRSGQEAIARIRRIPGVGLTPLSRVLRELQLGARGERVQLAGAIEVSTIETVLAFLPALAASAPPSPVQDAGLPDASPGP